MKCRLSCLLLILLALSANAAVAQSPAKILKLASKAIGEKAFQNLRSSDKKGRITRLRDSASGSFLAQTAQPNFYHESYDFNGFETESGFNGKSVWQRDSREGLRTLTGDASRDFAFEASFRNSAWLNYKKEKAKITANGQADVNGKTANSLLYTTAKGVSIKLYFDAATNLPLRMEFPAGSLTKTFDYSDYRIVDGVNEPFAISAKIGGESYLIKLEEISLNRRIAAETFDFPKTAGAPLPDIAALLQSLQSNENKIDEILENYSYAQKIIRREVGKDGILREVESETRQLSFYKGRRISRLVEKNGKPLSPNEQADEDKNAQKRVAEIEREIAKKEAAIVRQTANGTPDGEDKRISIAEVLQASNLVNPRRERFRGRDVIVFDFEPNPNFDFKNAKSFLKFFGKTAGVMWIDEKDKQVARLEAVLFDNFKIGGGFLANLKKGASFALEQERVNDEIWLPSTADINLSVKVLLVKGINVNQVIKSYNYQKFSTDIKDSRINEIKKP